MYTSDDEGWVFIGKKPLNTQDKIVIAQLNKYFNRKDETMKKISLKK